MTESMARPYSWLIILLGSLENPMRDEEKWKCPWCGRVATIVRDSIGDSRQCECGAVAIGAAEGDWDEVTDEAIAAFKVKTRAESAGSDSMLREDILRAGIEIRMGVTDPDMGQLVYQYIWFRRKPTGPQT
jgi:hypothetical protein